MRSVPTDFENTRNMIATMKRIKVMACMALLLGGLCNVSAADRAGEILGRVADGFRTMKRYTVRFEIVADDYRTAGGYAVSDGNYRLYLGDDAEVFSDGKVRYEVDHRRGEVTISEVNRSSRNILDNPVRAFDFLDSEYAFTLEWERNGRACVRLTPTDGSNAASGEVTLTVDTASMRPLSLAYDYDGERVDVSVEAIEPNADAYRAFDRKACDGYEFIDFR